MKSEARKRLDTALSLLAVATEMEVNVIDSMHRFYRRNKYLSVSQLTYLNSIIDGLSGKRSNVRFRIG